MFYFRTLHQTQFDAKSKWTVVGENVEISSTAEETEEPPTKKRKNQEDQEEVGEKAPGE